MDNPAIKFRRNYRHPRLEDYRSVRQEESMRKINVSIHGWDIKRGACKGDPIRIGEVQTFKKCLPGAVGRSGNGIMH
jgi:hypothetical protein